jgi:hypothetical protein
MTYIVYELVGGRGYTLYRGSHGECLNYMRGNPTGERGGSVHIRGSVK